MTETELTSRASTSCQLNTISTVKPHTAARRDWKSNTLHRPPPGDAGLARRQNEHLAGALPQQMLAKSPVLIGQLRTLGDQWP